MNAKLIATGTLRLYNVSRNNATTYFCVVANAVGSAHSKVQLIVEWAPTFLQQEKREIENLRGDDAYLHCDVDAKPSAKTKWLFNSKPLVFEDKSHLKLMNVQLRHAGTYKCIVSNVHGTLVRDFVLNVLEPPFISDFDMMDVQLKEGDNATLECNARGTPPPNVTWTYNNGHWHVEGTSLWSGNMSGESGGLFRCDATSPAGSTHLVYRVSVVTAARVEEVVAYMNGEGTTVGKTLELVRGSNVRVACKASGNPVPDIQWLRQGRPVGQNRYDISYADLTLAGVESTYKGLYTCVASNEGGSDDRRITVDVLEPPKIFQSLFEATHSSEVHLEVISGQSYYLHCHPYGNPFPEVYWFRDDVPLKLFDDTMVSTEFGEVIVVKEASEEQSGNYTCVARNKVGNTSVTYLVDVLVPPISPKESSRKVVATFGKELVLECPSVGTRPNVMWIKHPYTEINADKRISFADDNFTMIINKTIVSDSGNYSCILTNKVGTTEVMFEVVVRKRPSIAGNVGTNIVEGRVVPLRRSIVLKCEVDGHPFPQITWLKDTQVLSDSASNIQRVLGNSLLALWSVQARDAGQYICLAENLAGSAHRRYNVAVQVPAKWNVWSSWSLCNVTCGLGYQTRSRLCQYIDDRNNTYDRSSNSETIVLDESACKGPSEDRRKCHMPPCQEDGSKPRWSQWSQWSECSTTCGPGSRARTRKCKTKATCIGDNVQIKKCTDSPPCSPVASSGDADDFDNSEDISSSNPYIPDITFESEPEVIDSHYSPDVEEFYSASGAQSPTAFYDVEVKENLDGSVQGPCDPGYSHNMTTNSCDDVDECSVDKNQCHPTQLCANTAGAYRCTCPAGFLALAAGQRCLDINECTLESDGCEFSCVNTAGGYVCACPKHLRLHLDKHHCVIPSLYRKPFDEIEPDYISTSVDFPMKYTKYGNK